MRTLPLDRGTIATIVVAAALPMLVVLALQVPLRELLLKVLKVLA